MKFSDYMPDSGDYRDPTTMSLETSLDPNEFGDGPSPGWRINYISSTFLNGWINYVKPIKSYVVYRYYENGRDKLIENIQKVNGCHDLSKYGDDVLVLAKDDTGDYWYFWFDNDTSDCQIGRFKTESKTVVEDFTEFVKDAAEYLKSYHKNDPLYMEIDVKKSWSSFK